MMSLETNALLLLASGPANQHEPSSHGVMLLFAFIMMITYVGVAYERFHKTVAAFCGAIVMVALGVWMGVFPYHEVYEFLKEDLNIFGVIIGTGILVEVVGKSGLFHVVGLQFVRVVGGKASRLYFSMCALTFVFVSVLTIVPAMMILSTLVFIICRTLGYKPVPLLLSVAICANSGAIATFASGLPNIMIGTAAGIPYMQFIQVSLPYAFISLVIAVVFLRFAYRNDFPWKQSAEEQLAVDEKVAALNPWGMVEDRKVLYRSAAIMLGTVIGFVFAQQLGVGMDFIAMVGGTAALLFAGKGVEDAIGKVNWTVILFFMGLFIIIGCIRHTGALTLVSNSVLEISDNKLGLLLPLICGFSAVASSIVDNIPVAATLIPIVNQISDAGLRPEPLWWALVICCNLGGNGTPIGSISCVIAIHELKSRADTHIGWGEFLKLGGLIMLIQVVGAIIYIMLLNWMDWIPDLPS